MKIFFEVLSYAFLFIVFTLIVLSFLSGFLKSKIEKFLDRPFDPTLLFISLTGVLVLLCLGVLGFFGVGPAGVLLSAGSMGIWLCYFSYLFGKFCSRIATTGIMGWWRKLELEARFVRGLILLTVIGSFFVFSSQKKEPVREVAQIAHSAEQKELIQKAKNSYMTGHYPECVHDLDRVHQQVRGDTESIQLSKLCIEAMQITTNHDLDHLLDKEKKTRSK